MSSTVLCRMADGKLHNELCPTKQFAVQMLNNTLERHLVKGSQITEHLVDHKNLQYVVRDAKGSLVSTYEIVD
jgi:hypothetical protein